MRLLTRAQMQEADRRTIADGTPAYTLMQRAGEAVANEMRRRWPSLARARVTVLCGRGNNGGDGFVIASTLAAGAGTPPRVVLFGRAADVKGSAKHALDAYLQSDRQVTEVTDPTGWARIRAEVLDVDVVVDALVGTGLIGPLEGLMPAVVADLNAAGRKVIAVDLPSGLLADEMVAPKAAVRADVTVTFAAPKFALVCHPAAALAGDVVIADIGIPPSVIDSLEGPRLSWLTTADAAALLPPRARDAHKGTNGHVLVIAGSRGKTGAAALTALGALRSGAGLVTVATPESCVPLVSAVAPEIMTMALPEDEHGNLATTAIETLIAFEATVIAVGPGLGRSAGAIQMARGLVKRSTKPLVIDADALNVFEGVTDTLRGRGREIVVTPHPGEMSRLVGKTTTELQANRIAVSRDFAMSHGLHVVLKGQGTVVASPDGQVAINSTGNPGMATAGMGDVLTGVIASLLAQTKQATVAARLGVFVHGLAGDQAARRLGERGLMASDVIAELPLALRSLA